MWLNWSKRKNFWTGKFSQTLYTRYQNIVYGSGDTVDTGDGGEEFQQQHKKGTCITLKLFRNCLLIK